MHQALSLFCEDCHRRGRYATWNPSPRETVDHLWNETLCHSKGTGIALSIAFAYVHHMQFCVSRRLLILGLCLLDRGHHKETQSHITKRAFRAYGNPWRIRPDCNIHALGKFVLTVRALHEAHFAGMHDGLVRFFGSMSKAHGSDLLGLLP